MPSAASRLCYCPARHRSGLAPFLGKAFVPSYTIAPSGPNRGTTTLAALFDPRRNSLNAIRLGLAASVVVSHSWVIGNNGAEPEGGGRTLGAWAVLGFFAVSGYLITRSRLNGQPASTFYLARFLRIYPGFIVCLVVVAFVFAPLSVVAGSAGSYTLSDSLSYIARNLLLYPPFVSQLNIGTTIPDVPVPGIWNGALWTLFWEAACYVGVGVLGGLRSARIRTALIVFGFIIATAASVAEKAEWTPASVVSMAAPLIAAFCAGSLLFLFSDRIRVMPAVVAAAGVLVIALCTGTASSLAPMPVAVIVMVLGSVLAFQKIGASTDISYGVYIYGVPVQNLLEIGWPDLPLPSYILLSLAFTLPLAWLSFRAVEAPAMRLKSRFGRRSADALPVPRP